jgi:hypothetical protein
MTPRITAALQRLWRVSSAEPVRLAETVQQPRDETVAYKVGYCHMHEDCPCVVLAVVTPDGRNKFLHVEPVPDNPE